MHKKIIIAQKYPEHIDGIKEMLERKMPEILPNVSFHGSMNSALDALENETETIIITGQVFYGESFGGIELAKRAKEKNKRAKVYLYSSMSKQQDPEHFDGVLEKFKEDSDDDSGHGTILELLKKELGG